VCGLPVNITPVFMNVLPLTGKPYRTLLRTTGGLVFALATLLLASCGPTKNSYYFKTLPRDTSINTSVSRLQESVIRKNDQLSITVSSLNPEEDKVFNAAGISLAGGIAAATGGGGNGYLVDMDGNIQLHRLGKIAAAGLTRRQLKDKITTDIKPYLKDPVVTVTYTNHRVTVLGEVGKASVIPMPEENMSLLEVLGSSGDLNQLARKDNVLIIRETETGKQFKRLNLEDQSIFNSEWYYLKPDDVVYVEPSDKKLKDEKRARAQQTISFALSGASLLIIILDRVLK
jgi:polysaccharide biosynthesis/export protein